MLSQKLSYSVDTPEVIDIMTTVEIALRLNPQKNKDKVVRKACTNMRHRMKGNMKQILDHWRKQPDAFRWYTDFMNRAGL